MIPDGLLICGQRLAHRAFRGLHLAQLQKRIGIVLIELDCLLKGGMGAAEIFFLIKRCAQQIIESASVGRLGHLSPGGADGQVGLLLRQVGIHDSLQRIGGRRILIERLLIKLNSLRVLLLYLVKVAHLHVGRRAAWNNLHRFVQVLFGIGILLPIHLS